MGFAHHNPKQMPTLESLTGGKRSARVQSSDEMRAVFASMRQKLEA